MASVTESLGLPPAPNMFAQFAGENSLADSLFAIPGLPSPPLSLAPDPDSVFEPEGSALYGFQQEGVSYLLEHPVLLLGDEMGLGKSIQAIAALRLLINRGKVGRALILCPKNLLSDWFHKLQQWAPDLRTLPVEGPRRRRTWHWRCQVQVNVVGYETWREDSKAKLADPAAFDLVILDEVQRIKNPDTAIHQAVAHIKAKWRWGLTGTPMENSIEELLALFAFLKPGLLTLKKEGTVDAVRKAIAPYVLRRQKANVLQDLPPKEVRTVWLELTPVQRLAYDAAKRAGVSTLKQAGQRSASMIALALLTRLKLICNLDPPSGASCKIDFLEGELRRITQSNEKALIFSQYPQKSLRQVMDRLAPFGAELFDGSLSDWNRQMLLHRFQQAGDPRVLAISLKCGGVGFTLTRANHVYHFDHWWNPAVAEQAEDRAHRIGQSKLVHVTTLLTKGTVEERIAELVQHKRALFHQVMDPLTADNEHPEEAAVARLLTRDDLLHLLGE